jgi:hypothetical protein
LSIAGAVALVFGGATVGSIEVWKILVALIDSSSSDPLVSR